jgi:histidine triad (HIT) family protein
MIVSCIFCSIAERSAPAWVIHEEEHVLGFLDLNPATRGHALVIPRQHADDIWSITPEAFALVARATHTVAARLRDALAPAGMTLFQANRPAGWQDVFHLHLHVVPRYEGDSLTRPWHSSVDGRDQLPAVAEQLGGRLVSE